MSEKAKSTSNDWKTRYGVVKSTIIDTEGRLNIIAGVCEYKGSYLPFLAKASDKGFTRALFRMPPHLWSKAIDTVSGFVNEVAKIEKEAMATAVVAELRKLKELGIDVGELVERV